MIPQAVLAMIVHWFLWGIFTDQRLFLWEHPDVPTKSGETLICCWTNYGFQICQVVGYKGAKEDYLSVSNSPKKCPLRPCTGLQMVLLANQSFRPRPDTRFPFSTIPLHI